VTRTPFDTRPLADRSHDFETEGRQSERVTTPCAVCGLDRSASLHR
jgi:hypothetical protein